MPSYGLLITSQSRHDGEDVSPYRGIACGDPWPFLYAEDLSLREKELLSEIERPETLVGLPVISGSPQIVYDAIVACALRSIPVRLLLCSGENVRFELLVPRRKGLITAATFIGVDIVTCDCTWSCILDDFSDPPVADVSEFRGKLNENGLFANSIDANEYFAWRNAYIHRKRGEAGLPLDGSMPFPELPIDDIESLNVLEVYELPMSVVEELRS